MSGYFVGSYSGDRGGEAIILIDPVEGQVTGWFLGMMLHEVSAEGVSADDARAFAVAARSGGGDGFQGNFDTYDEIVGTWTFGESTGEFAASRALPDPGARYRFTGTFFRGSSIGFPDGVLVLNIDDQGNLVGESFDVTLSSIFNARGTYDDGEFAYAWGDGLPQTGSADPSLAVEGTGTTSNGNPRPWFAQGCRLN
jgi:hypothetical protein